MALVMYNVFTRLLMGWVCCFFLANVRAFSPPLSNHRPSPSAALRQSLKNDAPTKTVIRTGADYASYWEELLLAEYRQAVQELRERRKSWSRQQLEDSGICVFGLGD